MNANNNVEQTHHMLWNKVRLIGQKLPLKLKEIWAIRIRLQMANWARELALFNLAINSKLRGCDLVNIKAQDAFQGNGNWVELWLCRQNTYTCPIRDY